MPRARAKSARVVLETRFSMTQVRLAHVIALRYNTVQMISATYFDDFERRTGVWKIVRRDVKMHYFNVIPGAQMSPPGAA